MRLRPLDIAAFVGFFSSVGFILFAYAQQVPEGAPVLNQAAAARLLVKSDTTIIPRTRGLYIGDAAACTIAVVFARDTTAVAGVGAVTLASAQPGRYYEFSIVQLMSANTTCAAVTALY